MPFVSNPIVEVRAGIPGAVGRAWRDHFIHAKIERVSGSTPNKAEVDLYNLGDSSIQVLQTPGSTIQVLAGEDYPGEIFTGDIQTNSVTTTRKGKEIVTTVKATDGQRRYRETNFVRSYPAQTTRTQVLTDVLAEMRVSRGFIAPLVERVYSTSRYYAAPARLVLDQLFAPDRATWSIQGNALTVLAAGQAAPGNAPIISEQTGMLGIPERDKNGVKVVSFFIPQAFPGMPFVVQSEYQGGDFRATKVSHDVDSDGTKWETGLVGVQLRPAA
jgi:hypothetical protein